MFHLILSTWYGTLMKQSDKTTKNHQRKCGKHLRQHFWEIKRKRKSGRMWQVACGTQNWIQLARWFWLVSALPLQAEWRYVLWANGEEFLIGSCSEAGSTVMWFWQELREPDSIYTATQTGWLVKTRWSDYVHMNVSFPEKVKNVAFSLALSPLISV